MGIINRKGVETIDYTLLQKKCFIKQREVDNHGLKVDSKGMLDFTSFSQPVKNENVIQISSENSISPFSFLDNAVQTSSSNSPLSDSFSPQSLTATNSDNGSEINAVKIKIDDLEFKLTQLVDKLLLIESKLDNFERKVSI